MTCKLARPRPDEPDKGVSAVASSLLTRADNDPRAARGRFPRVCSAGLDGGRSLLLPFATNILYTNDGTTRDKLLRGIIVEEAYLLCLRFLCCPECYKMLRQRSAVFAAKHSAAVLQTTFITAVMMLTHSSFCNVQAQMKSEASRTPALTLCKRTVSAPC